MHRNLRLILGGLAALATGLIGGWTLSAMLPIEASAPKVASSVPISIPAPGVVEAAPPIATPGVVEAVPPARVPTAKPDPAEPTSTRVSEAPPIAPSASPADAALSKLHLRIALRHDGEDDDDEGC